MKKRIQIIETAILVGGLAVLASGCLDVTPAQVERVGVEAVKLGTFTADSFPLDESSGIPTATMRNVKAFLWNEGVPPKDVDVVKRISREIDRYEDGGVSLNKEREALENQADGAFRRFKEAKEKVAAQTRVKDQAIQKKGDWEAKLADELAKPAEQQNAKKIELYNKQITAEARKIEDAESQIAQGAVEQQQAESDAEQAGLDFGAMEARVAEIELEKQENSENGTVKVNELSRTVSFFAEFKAVRISFPPEGIQVSVEGWDVCMYNDPDSSEGTRVEPLIGEYRDECYEFAYSVENVSYDPVGGRVKFDVVSALGVRFEMNVVRTRYNDEFGRLFMQGRIKATFDVPGGPVVRHGIIKLVDRKN